LTWAPIDPSAASNLIGSLPYLSLIRRLSECRIIPLAEPAGKLCASTMGRCRGLWPKVRAHTTTINDDRIILCRIGLLLIICKWEMVYIWSPKANGTELTNVRQPARVAMALATVLGRA
jgi:hypothetical protein